MDDQELLDLVRALPLDKRECFIEFGDEAERVLSSGDFSTEALKGLADVAWPLFTDGQLFQILQEGIPHLADYVQAKDMKAARRNAAFLLAMAYLYMVKYPTPDEIGMYASVKEAAFDFFRFLRKTDP